MRTRANALVHDLPLFHVEIVVSLKRYCYLFYGNIFLFQAYYAQHARPLPYHALIIYNYPTEPLITMAGGKYADDVLIPVVMISYTCMQSIMGRYSAEHGSVLDIS
jgi:hypothetical protein